MGANLLNIIVTLAVQTPQPDTSLSSSPAPGIALERPTDLLQYNRVQGLSLGAGYQVPVPGVSWTNLYATVRYGFSDERVTGRLTAVRTTPGSRITLSGYHDIADVDPVSAGRTFANTFNALFVAHDNGDYALADGLSLGVQLPAWPRVELILSGRLEKLNSAGREARSAVNDFLGGNGLFPPNPAVEEGTFGGIWVQLRRAGHSRWTIIADGLGGNGRATGRLFGDVVRVLGSGLGVTLRLKAGAATEPAPPQSLFRLGGLNTVRGFDYGIERGPAFWAGQADITAFRGRIRPVVFLDAGQAGRMSTLMSGSALVGGGIGLSLYGGLIRFDLSRAISPDRGDKVRFDLVVRGIR